MDQPKKSKSNPAALNDAYQLFVDTGYNKSKEEFVTLLQTNPEALKDAHKLFVDTGYKKDINEFTSLIGVKKKENSASAPLAGESNSPKYRIPTEDDYKEMQRRGELPPPSEAPIGKEINKDDLYDMQGNTSKPVEPKQRKDEAKLTAFAKRVSGRETAVDRLKLATTPGQGQAFKEEDLWDITPEKIAKQKKSIAETIESKDLNLDHPFLYYSSYTKDYGKDNFVSKEFDEAKLESMGINPADFDGFINKNRHKTDFLDKEERGLFSSESSFEGNDKRLAREVQKQRMLTLYIEEMNARHNEKNKLLAEQENLERSYQNRIVPGQETIFDYKKVEGYIQENMPLLSNVLKQRDVENRKVLKAHEEGKAGFLYGAKQFLKSGWNGMVNRVQNLSATFYDKIGMDDAADSVRMMQDENQLMLPDTRDVAYTSGKKTELNGKKYLVDDTGNVYDIDNKIRVTDLFTPTEYSAIKESAKSGEEDWIFSPQGAAIQGGGVLGDLLIQIAATRGVGGLTGATMRTLGPQAARALSAIPLSRPMANAVIAQSALGYSSGLEDTLREAKEAGLSDSEAQMLATDASQRMALLYAITAPISPQTKATQAIFGAEGKDLIKKAVQAYAKGGKALYVNTIKEGLATIGKTVAKRGGEFSEEGLKELFQENIQQSAEAYIVNAETNQDAGKEIMKETMTGADFVNTSILAFMTGGLATQLKTPSLFKNTDVERLKTLQMLSTDSNFGKNLNGLVVSGVVSADAADKIKRDLEVYGNQANKVPKDLKPDVAIPVMSDLSDISLLEKKREKTDRSLHAEIDTEIAEKRASVRAKIEISKLPDSAKDVLYRKAEKLLIEEGVESPSKDDIVNKASSIFVQNDTQGSDRNSLDIKAPATDNGAGADSERAIQETVSTEPSEAMTAVNVKLNRLFETLTKNGMSNEDAEVAAVNSLTKEERDILLGRNTTNNESTPTDDIATDGDIRLPFAELEQNGVSGRPGDGRQGAQPAADGGASEEYSSRSIDDLENLQSKYEEERNAEWKNIEKELERREWTSVLGAPITEIESIVDEIMSKDRQKPNGYGSFMDKRDARETREVAEKYSGGVDKKTALNDFKDAFFGRPSTWYADGLKLRESVRAYTEQGGTFKELLSSVQSEFGSDGFTEQDAASVINRKLSEVSKANTQSPASTPGNGKRKDKPEITSSKKVIYKGVKYTVGEDGSGVKRIIKQDGTEISEFTYRKLKNNQKKRVKNGVFSRILAVATDGKTENELRLERKEMFAEASLNVVPTTPYEVASLAFANGQKVSRESIRKEIGEKASNLLWATGINKESSLPSVEKLSEMLMEDNSDLPYDDTEYREAIIDVLSTFESIDSVRDSIIESYQKNINPFYGLSEEEQAEALRSSLTPEELALYEAVQYESGLEVLSEDEKIKYYEEQYGKQLKSLSEEEQQAFYDQIYRDESQPGDIENYRDEESNLQSSEESAEGKPDEPGRAEDEGVNLSKSLRLDDIKEWLDNLDDDLSDFGENTLGINLPIVVARAAVKAMKAAVNTASTVADVISAGVNAITSTDWYKGLEQAEKDKLDSSLKNILIDTIQKGLAKKTRAKLADIETKVTERFNKGETLDNVLSLYKNQQDKTAAENIYTRLRDKDISEDAAYEEVSSTFQTARTEIENKKTPAEIATRAKRALIKWFSDRQYLPKKLLDASDMKVVKNLMINASGASGRAKADFEEAYNKIYKGLNRDQRERLDEIIQAKRFIAIDKNRNERSLPSITHPNFINGEKSKKFLAKLKQEIGDAKYNDLSERAGFYFKTYRDLLKKVYENGLISESSFEAMSDIDYQPRVFLDFITDFNDDIEENTTQQSDTAGLSKDQIKGLSEGAASSLVLNSEWLLTNSIRARYRAMAFNNINKRFVEEFKKSKEKFAGMDPKKLSSKKDKRFYRYFKELDSKIIDNPVIGITPQGNPKYKYSKTPLKFKKAYYYVDGQQRQFFIEKDLHSAWFDTIGGFISRNAKEFISYASGSALIKGIATGNNPLFPVVNYPRDFMFAAVFSDQYSNFIPAAMVQVQKDVAKAAKDIRSSNSGSLKKYIEYGGAMDFLSSEGRLKKDSVIGQALDKMIDPKARDTAKGVFDALTLQKISKYSELVFRVGVFNRSVDNLLKQKGYNSIDEVDDKQLVDDIYNEAVANARGLLDFNQGGTVSKDLESVLPYVNTAIQGTRVAAKRFQEDPISTTLRVLQASTIVSVMPTALSLLLISLNKEDEDKDKTSYEIYTHAIDGLSLYQRSQYMNIVTGSKNAEGEYAVIKIAKNQQLAPVSLLTDQIITNNIRRMAGKPERSWNGIMDDVKFSFNNNIMPIDVTSPAGALTRTPVVKAVLTYATGYDFYREEPLSRDIGKVPLDVEGIGLTSVENFYKEIGEEYGLSPVRTKGFVESLITSPNTNPYVGFLYGVADAIASDDDMETIGKDLVKSTLKSSHKRVLGYTSDFNRSLNARKDLQERIDKIKSENFRERTRFNNLTKKLINKEITVEDVNKELVELDKPERARMIQKIKDKISLKSVDQNLLDIKYEVGAEVKALMIMEFYGNMYDGSKESLNIAGQMKVAKGIWTDEVIQEYNKLWEDVYGEKK